MDSKGNMKKWISRTEHLPDVIHVPGFNSLDFTSYLLRLYIHQSYKNNKFTLISWDIFVHKRRKKAKRLSTNAFGKNSYIDRLYIHQ
jgi:hypothetical protein